MKEVNINLVEHLFTVLETATIKEMVTLPVTKETAYKLRAVGFETEWADDGTLVKLNGFIFTNVDGKLKASYPATHGGFHYFLTLEGLPISRGSLGGGEFEFVTGPLSTGGTVTVLVNPETGIIETTVLRDSLNRVVLVRSPYSYSKAVWEYDGTSNLPHRQILAGKHIDNLSMQQDGRWKVSRLPDSVVTELLYAEK